jgi:hypothetical protein
LSTCTERQQLKKQEIKLGQKYREKNKNKGENRIIKKGRRYEGNKISGSEAHKPRKEGRKPD